MTMRLRMAHLMRMMVIGTGVVAFAVGFMPPSHAATLKTVVSFCELAGCLDGAGPNGPLFLSPSGDLLGTTAAGGTKNEGTAFEISRTFSGYDSSPTVLYSFCAQVNCTDGSQPISGLTPDKAGNLFGTTNEPLNSTIFELVRTRSGMSSSYSSPQILANLFSTVGPPSTGVVIDTHGDLFGGLAYQGGGLSMDVFELVKDAGGYAATPTGLGGGVDCRCDVSGLLLDRRGNVFGTAGALDGLAPLSSETLFEFPKTSTGYAPLTTLYDFCNQPPPSCFISPIKPGQIIEDAAGDLIGTTSLGGANGHGMVYELPKTSTGYASTITVLVNFCAQPNCTDGAGPNALIADLEGNLFGTTASGGANNQGTVFRIAKAHGSYSSTPTTLINFCTQANCTDGSAPTGGLIADGRGDLFGVSGGGANNKGTVFEITDSGFVGLFSGQPQTPHCVDDSVSTLSQSYGDIESAVFTLHYGSVRNLQEAIEAYCGG